MNLAAAKRLLPVLSLALLCLYFAIAAPPFRTADNLFNIAGQNAWLLIASMGGTLIILAAGIDLSVGSVMAFSGVIAANLMVKSGLPIPVAFVGGLAAGAAAGAINGVIITRLRVPAFIATLGMLLVARGASLSAAKGVTVDGVPDAFNAIANARPLGIPMPLIITLIVVGFVAFLLHYTKYGRYVQAIGSNAEAARVSGVPVERVLLTTYILGGMLAGLAGLIEVARQGSGSPTSAEGYELDVVTAVVVGGASLSGGEGRVSGTILGVLLVAVLRNGLNLLSVEPFMQKAYIGLLIIAAVAFDQWARRLVRV
jgi:ribose/xylose/arabinose/galactoside ABC-type transport system permease subunit